MADPDSGSSVVAAILGASVSLAGLTLVFLGFSLSFYKSFPGDTSDEVKLPYRRAVWAMFVSFGLGLIVAAMLAHFLIFGGGYVYWTALVLFALQMVMTFVGAIVVMRRLL